MIIERAPNFVNASDQGKFWYAAICPEHGWVTKWTKGTIQLRMAVDDHRRAQGCAPEVVRTPGDVWARIPPLDPPKLKAAKAWQVTYWARCTMCEWATKKSKTATRPETFAYKHNQRTGHHVYVRRDDDRLGACVDGIVESQFRGDEQLVLL